MRFNVVAATSVDPPLAITPTTDLSGGLDPFLVPPAVAVQNGAVNLPPGVPVRQLTLNEAFDSFGRLIQLEGTNLLNPAIPASYGRSYMDTATETPLAGSTEVWQIANLTADTHPIHLHLVQFRPENRQAFDVDPYTQDWTTLNGAPPLDHPTIPLDPTAYLLGPTIPPDANEDGWKDTVRMNPGEVTRILVRFAPNTAKHVKPGQNLFPFDPTGAPGYVWHCHILEHEDNEMMRPMTVIPIWRSGTSYPVGNRNSPGRQQGLVDFNGVDFQARVANTSNQPPPQRPDLWERINNLNGDWAIQTIYNVGDRVFFQGKVYRALQRHQARAGQEPTTAPTLWAFVTNIPTPPNP